MKDLQAFKELLGIPRDIVIVTHHNPDADAWGSTLGLSGILEKQGHSGSVETPSEYPESLHRMKPKDQGLVY
jgi:phosphoesterase RecJ-like protein